MTIRFRETDLDRDSINRFLEEKNVAAYDTVGSKYHRVGSFLNPIPIKIFEETKSEFKMRFGISDFGTVHFQKILNVSKKSNLSVFKGYFENIIPNKSLEIRFFDLNGHEMDESICLDGLPENNDLFIQLDVDVGDNNPNFERQYNR